MESDDKEPGKDKLTEPFTSIISVLPPDAQRLVNELLPTLEARIDDEVAQYGRQLSSYLGDQVRELGAADNDAAEAELVQLGDGWPTDQDRQALEESANDAASELARSLTEARGRAQIPSRIDVLASSLRAAFRQLRRDVADGYRERGISAFELSLPSPSDDPEGAALTRQETTVLRNAVEALPDQLPEEGPGHGTTRDDGNLAAKVEEAAHKAGRLHARAGDAATSQSDPPGPSSPALVASRMKELQRQLDEPPAADRSGSEAAGRNVLNAVREARQAADRLDKSTRRQPFGVLNEYAKARSEGHADAGANLEQARAACAMVLSYYNAQGALAGALAELAVDCADLQKDLEALAADVQTSEDIAFTNARNLEQAHAVEAGLARLEHVVERVVSSALQRATAADGAALQEQLDAAREQLDNLNGAAAHMKENADRAVATLSACRQFFERRKDASSSWAQAIEHAVMAAQLPSIQSRQDS